MSRFAVAEADSSQALDGVAAARLGVADQIRPSSWKTGRVFAGEVRKLGAFLRRDFLIAWSYRLVFVSEWLTLLAQALMFYFLSRLVDPARLPTFGGSRVSYMEYVAVGIALGGLIQIALRRVAAGLRGEQVMGTIESLLMTPTAPATIQVGTAIYNALYIPLRTAVFLVFITLAFGLDLGVSGILPALVVLAAFLPFVWGLGIANAGLALTLRGGSGLTLGASLLVIFSGAYFPISVLPEALQAAAAWNPVAIAVDGIREPLLGEISWRATAEAAAVLAPMSAASLAVGTFVFRFAMRRERRRGSLGLY